MGFQQAENANGNARWMPLRLVLVLGFVGTMLFGSAGRFDIPAFWALLGLMVVVVTGMLTTIDRGLLQERMKPGPGGTDRHIRALMMPFILAHLVVAGLDAGRFHWSYVSVPVQIAGLVGLVLCFSTSVWAMRTNRFFSPVVRIQEERGHHLVTGGPYRFVRHPAYLASLLMFIASGLMLGSLWSLVPNVGCAIIMFRRVVIEDKYLHQNLDGYVEYAAKTRYRLVPGVW